MDQSIMYTDPELEASFSFSAHDFINSCVFSDVEDDDTDDEYIEISLEKPTQYADYNDADDGGYDVDVDGLELRISLSSSVPFLEFSNNINNTGLSRTTTVESLGCESIETVTTPSSSTSSSTSTSTSTLSCSSSATYWAATSATHQPSSPFKRKVQSRSVNRLLGSFLSIPRTQSETVDSSDNNKPQHESTKQVAIHTNTNHLDLFQTRKSPNIRKTSSGGIMMKLLIKCRSINIRTLLASLVKPYQIIINAPLQGSGGQKKKKRSSNNKSSSLGLAKPFEKWLVQRDKANSNNGERSRVSEINMDAIRGVLESMSTITSLGRRDKRITKKSSPPSTTSSNKCVTIKQGNPNDESKMYATTDNSIQAAIAHCKTSFGQPSDFCF